MLCNSSLSFWSEAAMTVPYDSRARSFPYFRIRLHV
jgi:hypothetical protein